MRARDLPSKPVTDDFVRKQADRLNAKNATGPRSGRPYETLQRQDRAVRLLYLRNRILDAKNTAQGIPGRYSNRISGRTVRRKLRPHGLRPIHILKGLLFKQRHRAASLEWARARRRWRLHTWQYILFTDKSQFALRFIRPYARKEYQAAFCQAPGEE
ncbi:unnamed protein product [Mytilus coruscus]|uniref:Transposase Tc1-like domain-containing protein n=1 Tax=Mytilus coruscus TaxID=42192 RepID=A0A6J8E4K3_MYTCO|nr:unnamed protein product [Mytilus coruscus]